MRFIAIHDITIHDDDTYIENDEDSLLWINVEDVQTFYYADGELVITMKNGREILAVEYEEQFHDLLDGGQGMDWIPLDKLNPWWREEEYNQRKKAREG